VNGCAIPAKGNKIVVILQAKLRNKFNNRIFVPERVYASFEEND
jgi:hypothetical protein